ncbi:M16 family metallopeptidase [Campylobacter corcagiensis]|uniref:Insulinase family protein n=1 Tax=Campylobacter corcagiensis TaxID=1448857 RepID=A0A7M1LH87_9BACT|nr:pitrilysin family protein [Campylobacter corcagiensis]QKF64633.1 zinc-dependent peptidase, M16 family [Campylobacter corcagiensis]QOQ87196.1 insulinase family protein [Campylobacter corcagiensis]
MTHNYLKLENGLEIYHVPTNLGSDVINVNVFYRVGSRNEVMGKSGIAHMLEHLNFKSTKTRPAGEFDATVKGFGGVNNASTGFDYTHYFIKCSNGNLDKSLELYADIMSNLNLNDEEFQPERDVVYEERLWRTDNSPFGYLFFRLYNNAFLYHPYHWTPIGFKDDIKNWTIDDIKEFHEIYYQPKNAVLLIAGDIDEKNAFALAKKHFCGIKNRRDIPKFHTYEPKQDGEKFINLKKDSEVEILALAYKIPPSKHEDTIILEAISTYLNSGKSSLLNKTLIEEKRLANQIFAYNMSSIDENLFIIFAVCNPEVSAKDVRSEILSLLDEAKKTLINDEDIQRIINTIKSDFVYSFDSASKVSYIYGSYILRDNLEALYTYEKRISKITKEDIKRVFNTYFINQNLTNAILKKD